MARTAYFRASNNRLQSKSALVNTPGWMHLVLILAIVAAVFCVTRPVRLVTSRSITSVEAEHVVELPEVIVTAPRRKPTLDGSAHIR